MTAYLFWGGPKHQKIVRVPDHQRRVDVVIGPKNSLIAVPFNPDSNIRFKTYTYTVQTVAVVNSPGAGHGKVMLGHRKDYSLDAVVARLHRLGMWIPLDSRTF